MITQSHLKELIHYDPITGIFTWIKPRYGVTVGKEAGSINGRGYRQIVINGKTYKAHRLAFLYHTGGFPPNEIDHVNRIKEDNRWLNLREATRSQNMSNIVKPRNNTNEFKGISWHKGVTKWIAQIQLNGKKKHLGCFDTPEEAHVAYCKASDELHGEFANHG